MPRIPRYPLLGNLLTPSHPGTMPHDNSAAAAAAAQRRPSDDTTDSPYSSRAHSISDSYKEDEAKVKEHAPVKYDEKNVVVHEVGRRDEVPHNKAEEIAKELQEQTAAHEGEDDIEYPKSWKLAMISIGLCLSVFCMALDNTIIATAIVSLTCRSCHDCIILTIL